MKEPTCNVAEFTKEMAMKYPNEISGDKDLDEFSYSNALFSMRAIAEDPIGFAEHILEKVPKWQELGEVQFEAIEEDGDKYIEAFLMLDDPCDEDLLKRALDEDFIW